MTLVDRDLRRRAARPGSDVSRRGGPGRSGGGRRAVPSGVVPLIADAVAVVLLMLAARAATAAGGAFGGRPATVLALIVAAGTVVAAGRVAAMFLCSGPGAVARPPADAAGGAVLAVAPLATVLVPLLRAGADTRASLGPALIVAALALGTATAVAWLPALLFPSLAGGRRQPVPPALLAGAAVGAGAVLVVPAAAAVARTATGVAPPDALLTYAAAAAATFGLAQIVALHRLARVGGRGVALVAAVALAVGAAEAALPAAPTLDDGVVGLVAASAVLLVGLGAATLVGGPRRGSGIDRFDIEDVRRPAGPASVAPPTATGRVEALEPAAVALVAAATAVGLAIRLVVGSTGGAGDALTARLAGGSLRDAVAGTAGAAHPPLAMVFAWLSRQAFGSSLLALRLPSLLAGLLLVPAAFVAGRLLYSRRTGLVAAAVVAIGPAFLWISADAGPAALAALLVCLAIVGLAAALRHGAAAGWVLFGLAGAALVWTHQFGVVTVAVLHAGGGLAVVRRYRTDASDGPVRRQRVAALVGWGGALAVTVIAVAALVGSHQGLGGAAAPPSLEYATNAAPSGGHTPFGLAAGGLSTIVGFHPPDVTSRLLALWPLGILAAFALFGRRWSARGVLLVGLAAAPFAALLLADLAGRPRQPPLALDWLAPALPAVALAAGRAVERLTAQRRRFVPAVVALVAVLALATADQTARVATRTPVAPAAGAATVAPGSRPVPSPVPTRHRGS